MPYGGSSKELPSYVQSLPEKKQRQWREVWNSSYSKAKSEGKSDKEAEGIAFRNANGVVKKMADNTQTFEREILIKSIDHEERIVYGVVMEPTASGEVVDGKFKGKVSKLDAHGHFTTAPEIRKAMVGFMEDLAKSKSAPHNIQHNNLIPEPETAIIENWQTQDNVEIGGKIVAKGSWVQGVKIYQDALWKSILNGVITGYSIEGVGYLADVEDEDDKEEES